MIEKTAVKMPKLKTKSDISSANKCSYKKISWAKNNDKKWLIRHDICISPQWIERCIQQKEIIVATGDDSPVGFLRFSFFWAKIPYMDMIWVMPKHRHQGIGKNLLKFWEHEMKKKNSLIIMTSAMQDEPESISWHMRHGFEPSGELTFGSLQETPELFFIKDIVNKSNK